MIRTRAQSFSLILILGLLTALSPFSIDMYLTAFPGIAADLNTTVAQVSLSLSAYFIGLSLGQLFYGPLLDRFGRKPPLYAGMGLYILASVGCAFARSIELLILLRLLQALGGCAAGVATMAMVRDLFSTQESAKVYSLLILILGVSPLLAPTAGGFLAAAFGWPSVFWVLALIALALVAVVVAFLPESHRADAKVSLHPVPIARRFWKIFCEPQFYTYVLAGATAFSGLFAYLAGSPVLFMEVFGVSAKAYGWIFAFIAAGLVGASQLNVLLLKRYSNDQIFQWGLCIQALIGLTLLLGTYMGWFELYATVAFLFLLLSCFGFTNPNSGALAMAPFGHAAGSAAALMGFLQMGIGALVSMAVGLLAVNRALPIVAIIATTSSAGLGIYLVGRRQISRVVEFGSSPS